MKRIDGKKVKELMESRNTKVIDVDSVADFKRSHIKGAVNIPHNDSDFVQKCKKQCSEKNQEMVLCGQEKVSRELTQLVNDLEKAGYQKVYQYQAGPVEWKSSKLTIQRDS